MSETKKSPAAVGAATEPEKKCISKDKYTTENRDCQALERVKAMADM